MGRKPAPHPLPLSNAAPPTLDNGQRSGETLEIASPVESAKSPRSPRSPFRLTSTKRTTTQPAGTNPGHQPAHIADLVQHQHQQHNPAGEPHHQPISAAVSQNRPDQAQRQGRGHPSGHTHQRQNEEKASKSGFFFNFAKSSKSNDRLQSSARYGDPRGHNMSRGSESQPKSNSNPKQQEATYPDRTLQKPQQPLPSRSDLSLASSSAEQDSNAQLRKGKPKPFTLLNRTRSNRDKDSPSPRESTPPMSLPDTDRGQPQGALHTAPFPHGDRSFRDMMSSAARNHSADRAQTRENGHGHRDGSRDARYQPSSLRENGGFFGGLKNSGSKAAGIISKGLFGKSERSVSTAEREPVIDDEHYVLKVINLPLVEQTRMTRISKRLEDSRDKTEFWMPSFPWRAIDYLNYKGTDVEGLYRVPGSGPQIKKWQRKFDEELDVDLFAQDDLYDINIIGSMLKAWLRELPDELFPKDAQERIARECAGAEKVPQMLIDELSELSPFNYYLLFAITCHLSLLLAHSDKNKMDFRNLCICFQPCMKIDAFCFRFLVCDWRECWKGCKSESKFIEEEYQLFDQPPPRGMSARGQDGPGAAPQASERNVSSSDSNKPPAQNGQTEEQSSKPTRLRKKSPVVENGSPESHTTISTNLTIDSQAAEEKTTPPRKSGDLRPLSPIKPLSPLGF